MRILDENGTAKAVFISEGVARAAQTTKIIGSLDGIELCLMVFGETEGLPEPVNNTFYIVSITTANAAKAAGRTTMDLLLTADTVRDENGKIVGCQRFALLQP